MPAVPGTVNGAGVGTKASGAGLVPGCCLLPERQVVSRTVRRSACGERRVQRAGGTHGAQPLHEEKVLEPPHLGLCAGIAGVSKLHWRWGRHARWGERPEASSPTPAHLLLPPRLQGAADAFAVERRAASQLCQQSSGLQPPGRVLSLESGSRGLAGAPVPLRASARTEGSQGQASLSRVAYPALSWGAATPPTGRPAARFPTWEAGPAVQRAGREEVGLTQQGGKGIRQRGVSEGAPLPGLGGPGSRGPRAGGLVAGFWRWLGGSDLIGEEGASGERAGPGRGAGCLIPGVWHRED